MEFRRKEESFLDSSSSFGWGHLPTVAGTSADTQPIPAWFYCILKLELAESEQWLNAKTLHFELSIVVSRNLKCVFFFPTGRLIFSKLSPQMQNALKQTTPLLKSCFIMGWGDTSLNVGPDVSRQSLPAKKKIKN